MTFYNPQQVLKLGAVTSEGVVDLSQVAERIGADYPSNIHSLLSNAAIPFLKQWISAAQPADILDEQQLKKGPAVAQPGKIICVGLNYRQHAIEAGLDIPKSPVLFSKYNNTITETESTIDISSFRQVDYEAELGVVIGKTAKHINEEEALEYILGYCNANDLSERELQFQNGQWLLGKTPDHFLPLGPYLVTADEIKDPQNMVIEGYLNGELRQRSNTNDMIFTIAHIISYISQHITLDAGDIIITGTPEGVIMGMNSKTWLQPGDQYQVNIGPLGSLTNYFK